MNSGQENRLKNEKSAYLKQHQDNPVAWWPYGPEALEEAKKRDLPLFLSIGYSSCHWCHVMAHESFESPEIAEIINQYFIPVKVDREEFPDLDQYYQQACQFFTQSGGWPLSAFLLPDLRPFFVGTYFPKISRPGLSSFKEVLLELKRAYRDEKELLIKNANTVTEAIQKGFVIEKPYELQGHFPAPVAIIDALKDYEDKEFGGHGDAPKFPHFSFNEWALEQTLEGMISEQKAEHTLKTLENMLFGGIYDHARGGIHRYSTDKKWLVPHFEKMLYDQAGLIRVLSKLSLLYPAPLVFEALKDTLHYIQTEMMGEEGYFFSAQDADSEGVEGLYFTFNDEEFDYVINSLNDDELEKKREEIKKWFNITPEGNFEHKLNVISLNPELKKEFLKSENFEIIMRLRQAILTARKERIPPLTDSKGIASWNFLLLTSLLDVVQYCRAGEIKKLAWDLFQKGLDGNYKTFLLNEEKSSGQTAIKHVTTQEKSLDYFEDYALFADLQLRTYEITGNDVFKNNFKTTVELIFQEFLENDIFLTRSKNKNKDVPYPNQTISNFDSSFKSPAATFLGAIRRGALLFADQNWLQKITPIMNKMIQESLRNPLGSGEALRSLTYPPSAYRVIKLPRAWINQPEFVQFYSYFMPRFVFDFHDEKNEEWQICSSQNCDMQGVGINNFMQKLTPKKEQQSGQS